MKATKATVEKAVDRPNAATRFYLFHGPDEAQSRSLAVRLLDSLGATKFVLTATAVKADPALLVDEAAALSLFGGKRLVWIEPAGKEIEEGVAALLDAPAGESAVVAIAGSLTKTSPLLKLAEASPVALAFASYAPEGQDAARMVVDLGRRVGLKVEASTAARLADLGGSDRAVIGQELQKLALYLDASPHAPKELDHAAIDEIGADASEGNFLRLADLAMTGAIAELAEELARLPAGGGDGIPVVRSMQRRILMLAPARARIDQGEPIDGVMASLGRAIMWKDKAAVQRMLQTWTSGELAILADRAGALEHSLLFSAVPEREALAEELLTIARRARSR